jgi:hypothetical protein
MNEGYMSNEIQYAMLSTKFGSRIIESDISTLVLLKQYSVIIILVQISPRNINVCVQFSFQSMCFISNILGVRRKKNG